MTRAARIEEAARALRDRMAQMTARLGEQPRKCYLIPADDFALAAFDAALALPADDGDEVARLLTIHATCANCLEPLSWESSRRHDGDYDVTVSRCHCATASAGLLARPVDRERLARLAFDAYYNGNKTDVEREQGWRLTSESNRDAFRAVTDAILREMGR